MRILTISLIAILLSSTSCYHRTVDDLYYAQLTSRLESAGHIVDTLIHKCEQGMIEGKYFPNNDSKSYLDFIKTVNLSGDILIEDWQVDKRTNEALLNLDINYALDSQRAFKNSIDTNSIVYKGVQIFEDISKQADISPSIITKSVLNQIVEEDFDKPLCRLLFFKFLTSVYYPDTDLGLREELPPFPESDSQQSIPINPKFVLGIFVNETDTVWVDGNSAIISDISDLVKLFLITPTDGSKEPESEMTKKIISLKSSRKTSVTNYTKVYNEIIRAYNEVRNEQSIEKYGKPFKELDTSIQKEIRNLIPMRISEAEPIEY